MIDRETLDKLKLVCNHLKLESRSDGIRMAIKEWINNEMWRVAPIQVLKEIFLEKEEDQHRREKSV